MKILGIIPSRYGSTRLPGKALIMVKGKTIIERVYSRVRQVRAISDVVVATDDVRIFNHVRKFGAKAMMTRSDHESGTMRCAEVMEAMPGYDIIVNIQGDEPLINPAQIEQLCALMVSRKNLAIGTLIRRIVNPDDLTNPSVVKVVPGARERIVYFSRSPVPFLRDTPRDQWLDQAVFYRHIGMYAYTRLALRQISMLPSSDLERQEKLEQLNWLYHGLPVHAVETEFESIGVDTPEDLELLEKLLNLT